MSTINLRIKHIVDTLYGGNKSKMATEIGIDEANIRNYIKGTEPKATFIEKILEKTEINIEWLLTGKGEIQKENVKNEIPVENEVDYHEDATFELNKKIDYLIKADSLNRIYIKTFLAHMDIKIDNFTPLEEELEKIKKTASN
jgi:transcriptional regulator with XRE-family HTH domain